ncbi:MAG: ABC transporter permease [Lentisphaerota bacterium]
MRVFKNFLIFIRDIINSRQMIWQMTVSDFKATYLGSYLGIVWAFIQPIVTIFVFWFIFSVGFKTGPTATGCPFILWLIAGMIPWFFLADALNQATNSVVGYSYLVKKVVFRVSTLPIIKILASSFVHIILLLVMLIIFLCYHQLPTFCYFQIVYFYICTFMLVLGISWLTSAINVFAKDITQIIAVILQLGFWATPIFWDFSMIGHRPLLEFLFKLNPAFYIIQGYRDSLIYNITFWDHHFWWTVYFWCFTIGVLVFGAFVFRKLRPHFADVL